MVLRIVTVCLEQWNKLYIYDLILKYSGGVLLSPFNDEKLRFRNVSRSIQLP